MTSTDCLLLDAKHSILDEHHRKFQALHDEGRLDEAMRQFHVTLSCASDLLSDALRQAGLMNPPDHPSSN